MSRAPHRNRMVGIIGCLLLLGGLFVLGGAGYPAPADSGPELEDSEVDPEEYAGEQVETGGEVVDTDPVVIEVGDGDETERVTLEDAPNVEQGHEVIVNGTITEGGAIVVSPDRAVVREPWETMYMYAISVAGAMLVAFRIADGWRFDPRSITFQPRPRPLHEQWRQGGDDG